MMINDTMTQKLEEAKAMLIEAKYDFEEDAERTLEDVDIARQLVEEVLMEANATRAQALASISQVQPI